MTHTKTRLLIAFLFIICPLESFSQVYTEYQRLIAQSHTRELYESFGSALSIDDTVAVVGASSYLDESKCVRSGGVYIFYQNAGGVDKWGLAKVLVGSDSEQLDRFGYSVCISGNIIAVGARTEDEFGKNAGAVYLFERDRGGKDNWGELKKITASDAESNDYFGESVSVNENLLAVGASSAGSNSGAVYIFEKDHGGANNWGEVKKLTELNSQRLGKSVCLSRDIVVVGSENDDEVAINAGAAYVFQKDHGGINNWGRVKKIIASDAEEIDRFGTAVSLNNNILVIGAPGAGIDGTNSGAAYIFRRDDGGANNWGEVKKITSSVQEAFQSFGIRVSISGDLILVGATQNDELGTNSGSAYIFQEDHGGEGNWGEVQKIRGLDTEALNYFGQSVSIYESKVFVGSSISSGAAYVFERNHGGPNNWGQVAKKSPNDLLINPPFCDVAMDSNFGYSVALSDDLAIVGAPNNNVNFGAAYIYQKNLKLHRWDLVKKILPADPVDGNRFGYTVSISNDLVVVGSYQAKNEDGQRTGAAYIFQRDHGGADNWGQVKKIIGSDTKGLDQFGRYVCVEGDIMTVTAFGSMPRKVYIFQKDVGGSNNWGEVKKITEPSDSYFGFSLAVQGDLILVGAPKDDEGAVWAGAIYVFQKDEGGSNNWGEVKKIIAFDADEKDNFGESISISGDMLLIGASGEFSGGSEPGCQHIYTKET